MKYFIAFLLSLVVALGGKAPPPVTTPWILIQRQNLNYVWYNAPASQDGPLASFAFPPLKSPLKFATFLVTQRAPFIGDLRSKTITMTGKLTSSPTLVWSYESQGGFPAHCRFFFSTVSGYNVDDGTVVPEHYWWSSASCQFQPNGDVTITAVVEPGSWSHALGQIGSDVPDKFDWAAQRVVQVGLAFCNGSFFDLGLALQSGSATFNLKSFSIQ